jgi:hypothetical protein
MSRTVVGRIFWKELRAQRSLWLGVTVLVVAIQALIGILAFRYRHESPQWEEWSGGMFLAAYLGATVYAIGSGAATFTEEKEAHTVWMLRVMPMTRADVFAGKWAYGIASTVVLLVALSVAAGIWSAIAWLEIHGGFADVTFPARGRHFSADEVKQLLTLLWIGLLIPIAFYAFSALFSLLCAEGIFAALCGMFTTILIVAAATVGAGFKGLSEVAVRLSLVAGVVILADYWLTGLWLRRGDLAAGEWRRFHVPVLSERWRSIGPHLPRLTDLLRVGEPVAPWRRAAQRLVWKECRAARKYAAICVLPATVAVLFPIFWPASRFFAITTPWLAVLATPLVMGVGAYQTEQLNRAYRFLANSGLTTDGSWLIKHLVWLACAFAICGYVLAVDQIAWQAVPDRSYGISFSVADSFVSFVKEFAPPSADSSFFGSSILTALVVAVFYVILAYSIGQRLSFAFSKGVMALGFAMAGIVFACLTWTIFAQTRHVPLTWTIGTIPPILLAYTWTHTERWQRQQLYSYRWFLVALWMALPFAGILLALFLYWPIPIR